MGKRTFGYCQRLSLQRSCSRILYTITGERYRITITGELITFFGELFFGGPILMDEEEP